MILCCFPSLPCQERRAEEVRRLQVRLRDRDQSVASLRHANAVLSGQLEAADRSNQSLAADAGRIADDWERFRQEQERKVRRASEEEEGEDFIGLLSLFFCVCLVFLRDWWTCASVLRKLSS